MDVIGNILQKREQVLIDKGGIVEVGDVARIGYDNEAAMWIVRRPQRHGLPDIAVPVVVPKQQQFRLRNPVIGLVMQTGGHLCHDGDELGFGELTERGVKVGARFRSKDAGARSLALTQLVRIEAQNKRGEG